MKLFSLFIGLLFSFVILPVQASHLSGHVSFPDVASDHDNIKAITLLQEAGLFTGYPDGTFGPQRSINRAELLKVLIASLGADVTIGEGSDCFPDVRSSDWFSPYVCFAAQQGWVAGYPDGTFRPDRPVNLAEALKMFVTIRQYESGDRRHPATGYERGQWYTPYVDTMLSKDAVSLETVTGNDDDGLDNPLTRMRAAEILFRTMLTEGRVRYAFDTGACNLKDVVQVTLRKFDLKINPDNTVIIDFDIMGTTTKGRECIISTHANPYAGVSRYWNSQTMFLVSSNDHEEILEKALVKNGKVYMRSGHETAGLGDDLWVFDLTTGVFTQIPFED